MSWLRPLGAPCRAGSVVSTASKVAIALALSLWLSLSFIAATLYAAWRTRRN